MDDKIHHFHRGINNTQLLHHFRESSFKEFVVQFNDDALFAFGIVNAFRSFAYRFVELLQGFRFFSYRFTFQFGKHLLHGYRYGIVLFKWIAFKQSFKNRLGNDVLCQHFHRLTFVDARIDVFLQSCQKVVKSLALVFFVFNQVGNALNLSVSNLGYIFCPLFPIPAVAHFLYHTGKYYRLQLLKLQGHLSANVFCGLVGCFIFIHQWRIAVFIKGIFRPPHQNVVGLFAVQFNLVDCSIKAVVMRPKCVENCPNYFVAFVIIQGFVGFHISRNHHGNDNVTVFFTWWPTHHTPYGLNDIHLRVSGRKEKNWVQRRHVNPFTQNANIRNDSAFCVWRFFFEPRQHLVTFRSRHRSVHVFSFRGYHLSFFISGQLAQISFIGGVVSSSNLFRRGDIGTESYCPFHRFWISFFGYTFIT